MFHREIVGRKSDKCQWHLVKPDFIIRMTVGMPMRLKLLAAHPTRRSMLRQSDAGSGG